MSVQENAYTGCRDVLGESNPTKPNEYKICWRPTKASGNVCLWVLLKAKGTDLWHHIASAVQVLYGGNRVPACHKDTGCEIFHVINKDCCVEIVEFAIDSGDYHTASLVLSWDAILSNSWSNRTEC